MRAFRNAFAVAHRQDLLARRTPEDLEQGLEGLAASQGDELRSQVASGYLQAFARLSQEVEELRGTAEDELERIQRSVEGYGGRIGAAEGRLAALQRQRQFSTLGEAQGRISELEQLLEGQQSLVQRLRAQLEQCAQEELAVDDLRRQNEALRAQAGAQRLGTGQLLVTSDSSAAMTRMQQMYAGLQKELADVSAAYQLEAATSQKRIARQEKLLTEREQRIQALEQQVGKFNRILEQQADDQDQNALKDRVAHLAEQNADLQQKIHQMEEQAIELNFGHLYYQKFKQQCYAEGQSDRLSVLENDLKKCHFELKAKDSEIKRLQCEDQTIIPATEQLSQLQLEQERLCEHLAQLQDVESENHELAAENDRLRNQISGGNLASNIQQLSAQTVEKCARAYQMEQRNLELASKIKK